MAIFNLINAKTGLIIRTMTGDSFSRAVEAEAVAGRTLANADLTQLGKNGDPTALNLSGATLTNAILDGADLTGALLHRADLTNASMKRTRFIDVKATRVTTTGSVQTDTEKRNIDGNL